MRDHIIVALIFFSDLIVVNSVEARKFCVILLWFELLLLNRLDWLRLNLILDVFEQSANLWLVQDLFDLVFSIGPDSVHRQNRVALLLLCVLTNERLDYLNHVQDFVVIHLIALLIEAKKLIDVVQRDDPLQQGLVSR